MFDDIYSNPFDLPAQFFGLLFVPIYSDDMQDAAFSFLVFSWILVVLVMMSVIRLAMLRKLRAKLDMRNEEYKNQGICFDLAGNELFIYVFQPFDVIGSYKQDLRTAKYFN
jgi:hypothetical protein